jgi:hypothetical protein
MPLGFLEVKKPNNEGGIQAEFLRMINQRLVNPDWRKFFNLIQMVSFSNNMEYEEADDAEDVKAGSFYTTPNGNNTSFSFFREDKASYHTDYPYKEIPDDRIKEITVEENWDNVTTKILPVGKDGILLNGVNPSASIWMTSSVQYDIPYCKTVSFSQDFNKDDYPTEEDYKTALVNDLRAKATEYLSKNSVPQINYTLKANLDKITDIGDIIEVKDERLGLDLLTNVLAFEYDCILEKYTSVEFGNFKRNLSNLMKNIQDMINQTITERENQ